MPTVPNPENTDSDPAGSNFRIVGRSYSNDATPLVEVLVMLHDWSIARQMRARMPHTLGDSLSNVALIECPRCGEWREPSPECPCGHRP